MNFKFIFIIVFTFHLNHLSAQFSEVGLNSGIIQTDIRGGVKGRTNKDCNSLKTGWIFSVNIDYKIKNWLKIKGIVNYQERKALETFTFPTKGNSGIGIHTFCKYPTSPQSDIYNPNIYKHFPNFKYVGIELVPTVGVGTKFRLEGGVGLFVGVLLNKDNLIFTKGDLSSYVQPFFAPPFNLYGDIRYNKYDLGGEAMISLRYKIRENININIGSKYYYSLSRLNDTLVYGNESSWDTYWIAYSFTIGVTRTLK